MNNVRAILPAATRRESVDVPHVLERVVSVFPSVQDSVRDGQQRASALAAFVQRSRGRKLSIRYIWPTPGAKPMITVALEGAPSPNDQFRRSEVLRGELDVWLKFIWPAASFGAHIPPLPMTPRLPIVPESHDHWASVNGKKLSMLVSADTDTPLLEQMPWRQIELSAALGLLQSCAPAELIITMSAFDAEARHRRSLEALIDKAKARGDRTLKDEARTGFLRNLSASGQALRIGFEIAFGNDLDPIMRDLVSYAIFGCAADPNGVSDSQADFRCLWPLGNALPQLLVEPTVAKAQPISRSVDVTEPGMVLLGHSDADNSPVGLSARDRARHVYMIGGTGTGKSTLLANMMLSDMEKGEGLILIDPHGDLADDVRRLVPEHRKEDVVWCDFSAPETILGLNILEMTGSDPEIERSIIANQLTNLFMSILYRDVDAFGPMFDQYFRNGLMLLMCGAGRDANLVDFERVFHDASFRRTLLRNCDDAKVKEFWDEIAENVCDSVDHSLEI